MNKGMHFMPHTPRKNMKSVHGIVRSEEYLRDQGAWEEDTEINNIIRNKIQTKREENDLLYDFLRFGRFIGE